MSIPTTFARKAAYVFLILCFAGLVAIGGYRVYNIYGPSNVSVGSVPYGLAAGSKISRGDTPDVFKDLSKQPVQVQAELRRSVELMRNRNYKAAHEILQSVVIVFPSLLPALWCDVNALFEIDSLSAADSELLDKMVSRLQTVHPSTGLSSYLDSRKAYRMGNENASFELARLAVSKAPALYEARLWLATLFYKNGRFDQAAENAQMLISLSVGEDVRAYELLAKAYHGQGKLDSCEALLDFALTQYPIDGELQLLKGFLSEYRGHFDVAEKIYNRILALSPDFVKATEALSTLGEKVAPGAGSLATLSPQDRAQVAVDILEPMVARYPENLPLREALGLAYLKGRIFDQAKAQFMEIAAQDPDYPDIAQRIKEASAVHIVPVQNNAGLASDLNRAVDSLRGKLGPSTKHDFTTMLGHYLVRYGASPKEFFKHYSITNFRPVKTNVWQESFYDPPYMHKYTVVFDSLNRFNEVHVSVFDSSANSNHLGMAPEVFTRLLKQNSRISGIGNSTGETDCDDGVVIDAAVWETQDNFEILARFIGKPQEVRMVRFDKKALPPGLKLCDYIPYLNQY
ncbi:MAG: hypothetical protein HUK21_02050 [Fibrobacteraceae bacterium]|nr:hypothetical protein [Fibrobacteraceae bacterium]